MVKCWSICLATCPCWWSCVVRYWSICLACLCWWSCGQILKHLLGYLSMLVVSWWWFAIYMFARWAIWRWWLLTSMTSVPRKSKEVCSLMERVNETIRGGDGWPSLTWSGKSPSVVGHSGRMSVFGRRKFPALRSTCSWWVTTYVGKLTATGQPTRPTRPFILTRSINWVISYNVWMFAFSHGWRSLVNAYGVKAWCGWLERWCVC